MSPKNTAILIIVFSIVMSLSILGVFDTPIAKNTFPTPTRTPTLKSAPTQIDLPKFILTPIRTPKRTPLTLRLSPTITPAKISQPTQSPISSSIFEGFESSSFEQSFTALDLFGGTSFGGKISDKQDCDLFCGTSGELITVGPPRGGTFMKTPSTKVYEFQDIDEGNWVLGKASGFGICFNFECGFSGCSCEFKGSGPKIEIIGTSK